MKLHLSNPTEVREYKSGAIIHPNIIGHNDIGKQFGLSFDNGFKAVDTLIKVMHEMRGDKIDTLLVFKTLGAFDLWK